MRIQITIRAVVIFSLSCVVIENEQSADVYYSSLSKGLPADKRIPVNCNSANYTEYGCMILLYAC